MKYPWLRKEGDTVYFQGNIMEIIIPKYYFDKNIAKFIGNKIDTLGLYAFRVIDEKGNVENHYLKLPMNNIFEFDDYRSENIKINADNEDDNSIEPAYVFILKDGQIFMDTVKKEQTAENSKNFVFSLHGAKIPSTIPYPDVFKLYIDNLNLNGTKIGNPGCILEMTIAELARCKDDINIPFRKKAGKDFDRVSMLDYRLTNIKNLPPINSTFTALAFENMDASIISSIGKNVNGEDELISPIEKVIKY